MAHAHNKIILLLMIKNESRIIERCIRPTLEYVDAVALLDTGSTDNTVEVCEAFLSTCGKPYKISVDPFKNFGHTRTVSFQKAQELCQELGWDGSKTYALAIDADMVIKPSAEFREYPMTLPGYHVIQKNGALTYYNSRFMRCDYPWKCIGGTHEYWSGDPTDKIPESVFYIDDIGDGGCKADKFERDIRLLTEDLKEDPNNGRAHFYLAQSLKDSGKALDAIQHYKRRIQIGGWEEEVWFSHYMIGKCYQDLKEYEKMEAWMVKAWKRRHWRAEPLYHLTKFFREQQGDQYKAYYYYLKAKDISFPKDDLLFVEHAVYNGLLDYENTILSCYVTGTSKQDALYEVVSDLNKQIPFHIGNVWENLHYYIDPLVHDTYRGEYTKLSFPQYEEYRVSSCCVIPYKGRLLMNTRYVNYSIDSNGCYHMRSPDGHVKTKNGMVYLNHSCYPVEEVSMMDEKMEKTYDSNIEGLEDVRLFWHGNTLKFSASSKNLTNDGKIVIAVGDYDPEANEMKNIQVLEPPRPSDCEKNWIAVPDRCLQRADAFEKAKGKMNFIYGWHPLEIGVVNEDNKLEIHTKYDTPAFFGRFRGSSTLWEYQGKVWSVVHFVRYSTPRVYYHCLVQFDRDTMKPEMYSLPFCFRKLAIEYCLGLVIQDGQVCFIFSQNDTDPGMIHIPLGNMRFVSVP